MAMDDSDLALAVAIAENSSSSQDDDFQLSSHVDQRFILNKLTASYPSKRQKRDRLSQKKAPTQKTERILNAGKENQNPIRRIDTFKVSNPELIQAQGPLTARKNGVSLGYATREECDKEGKKEKVLCDASVDKVAYEGPEGLGEGQGFPEKPLKQASSMPKVSRCLTVDDAFTSSPRPMSYEPCWEHAHANLTSFDSPAADCACANLLRAPANKQYSDFVDGTLATSCSAVDAACITPSNPSLDREHNFGKACVIVTTSQSLVQADVLSRPSKELNQIQASPIITGGHSACTGLSLHVAHEHGKQEDEALGSSKLSTINEDAFEMLRKPQHFSEADTLHQSPEADNRQWEEAAVPNRVSPVIAPSFMLNQSDHSPCKDGAPLLDTDCDAPFSLSRPVVETVSLAEEDGLTIDAFQQKQWYSLEPEHYKSETGTVLAEECLPSANLNPESQLNALLSLCADAASCSDEEIELKDDSLSNFLDTEDCISSLMTQTNRHKNLAVLRKINEGRSARIDTPRKSHVNNVTTHVSDNEHMLSAFQKAQTEKLASFSYEGAGMNSAGVGLGTEPADIEQFSSSLECPVCGDCITDLSLEQREVHTNACLDSVATAEAHADEGLINGGEKDQGRQFEMGECVQENCEPDLNPVMKWLESLNLSRYASVFVREEIDWDTLKCLTDEDLSMLGITALGPRRKILHAVRQMEMGTEGKSSNTLHQEAQSNNQVESDIPGRKLITDFFELPPTLQRKYGSGTVTEPSRKDRTAGSSGVLAARKRISTDLGCIPEWLSIPGTTFRVDAFQHLRADCTHWFLTHFHTDHYQGLTKGFRYGIIYCSPITAQLVNTRIGVPWDRLKPLPLNEKIDIDGVKVTMLDANHCPGSVMILFEPQNGKAVLHTGDFRFCEAMTKSTVLQGCNIHTLILDTTYCNPQYDFPTQEVVIRFIIDAIQAEAFNPSTLFLIGTYTIGKERVFFEVAKVLQKKIHCCATKLRLLQCMKFPDEDMKWMTTSETDAHIHVVPLWSIASFKRMNYISRRYHGKYNSIVSFSPTGWSFGRGKKSTPGRRWQRGTIVRYEVPYSEHCSFKELREFVRFIDPVDIVPSVNNDSAEAADALIALLLNEEEKN